MDRNAYGRHTSRRRRASLGAAAFGLALAGAIGAVVSPASAAEYTWLSKSVNPNGSWYSDRSTGATSFSRTGVSAKIDGADGYTWKTVAWYNGYSNTGQGMATQNGPRGYGETKAQFTFLPGTGENDRIKVKAWLLNAVLGRSAQQTLDASDSESNIEPPASVNVTAADLRNGQTDGFTLTSYGETGGGELWSGVTSDGETCIFVLQDEEYVGSSCAEAASFAAHGLSLHMEGPNESLQVALAPSGGITEEAAAAAGLVRLTDAVAINAGEPVSGHVVARSGTTNRSAVAAPTTIVLVKGPGA